jgi:hypothetical protein
MFERGKEFERGRSPLSLELPFPATNICGFLSRFWLERGRGEVIT